MKKATFSSLASLLLLVSCGGSMEVEQALGDGNVENDAVYLRYTMPSNLKNGDKIQFSLQMEKDAPQEEVSLGISYQNPLLTDSYSENVLFSVSAEDLVSTISGSSFKVEHVFLDVSKYFEEKDNGTFYFVFHRKEWTRRDITSYSSMTYHYNFDGRKMKLIDD